MQEAIGIDLQKLLDTIHTYNPDCDDALIAKAFHFAREAHKGQKRASGEEYFIHPVNVAYILTSLHMDDATICAALMHDVLEDTEVTYEEMSEIFGEEITMLVDGVTKLKKIQSKSKVDTQVENYRKMVMAMAKDIRVIIIKLADRLHNLRTLEYKTRESQKRTATETLEIYAPLAHRLGINTIKWQLEDLSLKYLEPNVYLEIQELVNRRRQDREEEINLLIDRLSEELERFHIRYDISGRPKSFYSIYKKMYKQNKTFDQIFDLMAIRVIVDSVKDCYSVLGIVHTLWRPIPGRFKDYIAMPKPNQYQSLHTTVIGPRGKTFEVQIRDWDMHRTAEYGIAAHWIYKEGTAKATNFDQKLTWIRQLMEWQQDTKDSKEFMETMKMDFFSDEVYVFSPKGDVIELPQGATPIDFAYRVHTQVGNRCVGAKVDGKIVPLTKELKTGNIVEILTSSNSTGPSRDWLKIVKSSQAKSKIKQWFRKEKKEENIERGREMLEREVRKEGYNPEEILKEDWLLKVAERQSFNQIDDMYAALGFGSLNVTSVLPKLKEWHKQYYKPQEEEKLVFTKPKGAPQNVVEFEGGQDGLTYKFARCCTPVPGDPIIGFITKGRGISIHRQNCPNIINTKTPERMIRCRWTESGTGFYQSKLQIISLDYKGYLASVTEAITKRGINVSEMNAMPNKDRTFTINIVVEVESMEEMEDLIEELKNLNGTLDVYRVKS